MPVKEISYPIILDGGLSNVLEGFGCDLNHDLWSARLIKTAPESIVRAHLAYLRAGARCITTSGYQASVEGFVRSGISAGQATQLILKSVDLAIKARALYYKEQGDKEKVYIAASMGPYGAMLADGSEYKGNYGVSEAVLSDFHLGRIQLINTTKIDFFAFETIPSLTEVSALSKVLDHCSMPCWVSFSCKDALHLNDGSAIDKAAGILANSSKVFALGVNCTQPRYISDIIEAIKGSAPGKKIIVYPNSGEVYQVKSKTWKGVSDPFVFEKMAQEWRKKGADIIGGCCRIGPGHISRIKNLK